MILIAISENRDHSHSMTILSPSRSALLIATLACLPTVSFQAEDTWWTVSDAAFAQQYAKQATSPTIADQSSVAWMLFARVNQQVSLQGKTLSQWEVWPSNRDTFIKEPLKAFLPQNKSRTALHLQDPKDTRLAHHLKAKDGPPRRGGEEVTRNSSSYSYIIGKQLNTKKGIADYFSSPTAKVDFPIGAVEIKASWSVDAAQGDNAGAYKFVDSTVKPPITYSLLGLHIMTKVAPTPADPFASETPSWFWTTFEFMNNPGLAHAQSLITYPDALPQTQAMQLLAQAGLGATAFLNYRCNGTQIRFSDEKNPTIVLGNTQMENNFALPPGSPVTAWTKWNSSCHSCHGTASWSTGGDYAFPQQSPIGTIKPMNPVNAPDPSPYGYRSFDFVWSIPFHAK